MDEEPDDVHLSPECRLWSSLQELTASRSEEARQFLINARTVNHDTHLVFVAIVYKIQQRAGRNATIEHPWPSRAWQTKAFLPLVGFTTYIDQCELDLELPNDDGVVLPVKKPTCLLTTRHNLFYSTCCDLHALATINTHRVKATFRDKVFSTMLRLSLRDGL